MRILLDITRTLARRYNSTPTGIDRVEHALARWLVYEGSTLYPDAHFVITAPYLRAALTPEDFRPILTEIEGRWAAANEINGPTKLYKELRQSLESPIGLPSASRGSLRLSGESTKQTVARAYTEIARLCLLHARKFHRLLRDAERTPTLYLHSSHTQLEKPQLFRWTKKANIRTSFFIHDIIPIDFPEFCGNRSEFLHKLRMKTVSEYGTSIVANSNYTKDRLSSYFEEEGLATKSIDVSYLGNVIQEYKEENLKPPASTVPYFICLSTIEGRKNIQHILNVWRQIIQRNELRIIPRLIIVGRRGWKSENVIDVLDRTRELAPFLIEVSDLSDVELAALMTGSAGLLSPSLVEGYSLPPIEGAARHIPVVASDIPVHREILGEAAIFLDPTDGPGWRNTIMRLATDDAFRRDAVAATYNLPRTSWADFARDTLSKAVGAAPQD